LSWAALANSRKNAPHEFQVVQALDKMMWDVVGAVKEWKA
jgi:hypothetical protein